MHSFRLALAQINPIVGDLQGNKKQILHYINLARSNGADLVAFPEMSVTGYPAEDLLYKPSFIKENLDVTREIVRASKNIVSVVGFVDLDENLYNAAAISSEGNLIDIYHKIHLPNYGVFDEDRYFNVGNTASVYKINGVTVGVTICEDSWYQLGPMASQEKAGAELIININASPYETGKQIIREQTMFARANEHGLYIAYVNAVGGQDELVFDGSSFVLDPTGTIVCRAKRFEEDLVIFDLNINSMLISKIRNEKSPKNSSFSSQPSRTCKFFQISEYRKSNKSELVPHSEPTPISETEEIYQALVAGTLDYVRKSGFEKVIIGLSGGIDSALTACIATDALGPDNVIGVSMPSRFSSQGSILDAQELSQNLGINLWSIPIEEAHQAYMDILEEPFAETDSGIAEENLQPRIRGTILMAISNKFGWMVLATGNKSEMAMGYATLYGDMAGGFAVLKDVPKTTVYKLAEFINLTGSSIPKIPQSTLNKPPSAELKPGQTDQDSLPPYEILDPILKNYIEEDLSFGDIVSLGYDESMVRNVIAAVDRNEYKRRQAPPGVKISPKAFGKDRRLPIVNHYKQT